jgi:hypothetical protein
MRLSGARTACLSALVFVACARLAAAGLELKIAIHQTTDPSVEGSKAKHAETDSELRVTAGKTLLRIDDGAERALAAYDFDKHRVWMRSTNGKSFTDISLFAPLGFRVAELQNRMMMGTILSEAGAKDMEFQSPEIIEHLFSLPAKKTPGKPERAETDDTVTYRIGSNLLAEWTKQGTRIDNENAHVWTRFLRYQVQGHPKILAALAAEASVPQILTIVQYDIAMVITTRLETVACEVIPDPETLGIETEAVIEGDGSKRLYAILRKVMSTSSNVFEKAAAEVLASAEKDLEAGAWFEAFLGFMEYSLQTGGEQWTARVKDRAGWKEDPDIRLLGEHMEPRDEQEAEAGIAVYKKLRGRTKKHDHVLMIFEANNRARLGKSKEAVDHFLGALDKNPYITGVYKDLGDVYFGGYQTVDAWRCYDTGRRICPGHRIFESLNKYEQRLMADYPEYF